MTPTEKELEQARAYADKHLSLFADESGLRIIAALLAEFRADGQREVFERCCKIILDSDLDQKYPDLWREYTLSNQSVEEFLVNVFRAAFPQFSKPGEGQ